MAYRALSNALRQAMAEGAILVECLECGLKFLELGNHLRHAHATDVAAYLLKHELPLKTTLVAPVTSARMRAAQTPENIARFTKMIHSAEHVSAVKKSVTQRASKRAATIAARPISDRQEAARATFFSAEAIERRSDVRRAAAFKSGRLVERTCAGCGVVYVAKHDRRLKFCSQDCYWLWMNGRPLPIKVVTL